MGLTCMECGGALVDSLILCQRCRLLTDMIIALQMAYRKHVLADESVGWEELGARLQTVLAEALGDRGFQAWLQTVREGR